MPQIDVKTVTIELSYDDALRLWVLVNNPANAGQHSSDERIRKLVNDAVSVVEDDANDQWMGER